MMNSLLKKTTWLHMALIIIVGFAIYANSLKGEFIWDDHAFVKDNAYIRDLKHIYDIFTKSTASGAGYADDFYRPLQIFTYLIDYSIWGLNVFGYHLTNILLHILVGLTLYGLLRILFGNKILSLLASLLFVTHPIQTEAVCYISGRSDLLSSLFMLLCLIFYIRQLYSGDRRFFVLTLLSYTLSLLSKENAVILPVILLLYHYAFRNEAPRIKTHGFLERNTEAAKLHLQPEGCGSFRRCLGVLFTRCPEALAYAQDSAPSVGERAELTEGFWPRMYKIKFKLLLFMFIITVMYILLRPLKIELLDLNILFKRTPGFFVAIVDYLRILFFPFNLHMEYGNRIFTFTYTKAILGLAILSFLLIYAFPRRDRNKLFFFSTGWFLINLLPTSGLLTKSAFYMAEHWLYLPSVGFFLIFAETLLFLHSKKSLKILIKTSIIGVLFFYSYLTILQNKYWNNEISFYKRTLQYAPESARLYNNLCRSYVESGKNKEALVSCGKAIKIKPNYPEAYCNLGDAYRNIGNNIEAMAAYNKATKINPKFAFAYFRLGQLYSAAGNSEEAIKKYERVIEINPNFPDAYNMLCDTYLLANRNPEALQTCRKSLRFNPNQARAYYNIGRAYDNLGEKQNAIEAYSKAVEIDPRFFEAYNNLAAGHADNGEVDKAIELWNRIIQINPNFSMAHFNLAVFYYQQKKYDLAINHCDKVIELGGKVDPGFLKLLKPYRK